ncbi:PAS domain-containing protein [bacterium]|nr:PAS domain-containing protein [bacterium]
MRIQSVFRDLTPSRILLLYLFLATARITVNHAVILNLDLPRGVRFTLQALEDIVFVALTGAVLFGVLTKRDELIHESHEALRKSEALYGSLVGSMDDYIFLVNHRLEYEGVWGGPGDDDASVRNVVGKTVDDVFSREQAPRHRAAYERALSGNVSHFDWHLDTGDRRRYFHTVVSPIRDPDGGVRRLVGVSRDVTRQHEFEDRLQDYQNQLRSMVAQLELAEERERKRIATEIHDRIAQSLALVKIRLSALVQASAGREAQAPLEDLVAQVGQAIVDTRALTYELSPPVLHELGFRAAVAWLGEQAQIAHGLPVQVDESYESIPLSDDSRLVLFTGVRELLNNVVKHAGATGARVTVAERGAQVVVEVRDNGIGFDPALTRTTRREGSFGLFNLRERVRHLGGRLEIDSRMGEGTVVRLIVPRASPAAEGAA